MSEFSERPRTKKKSKGKKKKGSSNDWIGTVMAIVVLGLIVAGAILLGRHLGQPPAPPPVVQSPWPPPAGTPREKLFGDHPGDTVVPASDSNYGSPLRRRFCDPWIRLSNVRSSPPKSGEQEVKFDLEVATPAGAGIRPQLHVEFPQQPAEPNQFAAFPVHFFRIAGLEEAIQRGRGTVTLLIPTHRPGSSKPLNVEGTEIYMLTVISSGRFPRQPQFKVSPSIFVGSGGQTHPPREWREEEVGLITGWKKQGDPPGP